VPIVLQAASIHGMKQFEAVELQGRVMGHWSTSVCPWLYDTKKDTEKENAVIDFLNKVSSILRNEFPTYHSFA
jgi:hypothetical protein